LKRGFTFYSHESSAPFHNDDNNVSRLLVAASPDNEIADAHWFREDVDLHLVQRAITEGVNYIDNTRVIRVNERVHGVQLELEQVSRTWVVDFDLVVDASGAAGAVAAQVGSEDDTPDNALNTGLVYGHFEGVRPLRAVARGTTFPEGPYPDEHAAVHHLINEGWMYELWFDHGVISAGFVIEEGTSGPRLQGAVPSEVFQVLLSRYPTLATQFARAQPTRPLGVIPRLQRRRSRAAGAHWVLLPHTYMFWSPLFSTGIAWSLVGVERLGLLLEHTEKWNQHYKLQASLQLYARALETDAEHLRVVIEAAYNARHTFEAFDAVSQAYFAAASYEEALQRLCDPPADVGEWAWRGFLGATDPIMRKIVDRVAQVAGERSSDTRSMTDIVARIIAPRNVAGLANRDRKRLYPVNFNALVEASSLLDLHPDEMRARVSRLRAS
jgi:FADH2 O2-dependent halogenase